MQCQEVREHLHAYADGELSVTVHDAVARSLAHCPGCQEELSEILAIQSLAREAFTAPVEQVDFSGFADGVMTRIGAEASVEGVRVERSATPGLLSRISAWLGEVVSFERPVAAFAGVALVVALIGTLYVIGKNRGDVPADGTDGPAMIAKDDPKKGATSDKKIATDDRGTRRRGPEREHFDRRNAAELESHRVAGGRIFIEKDDKTDRPAVVWHVDSEAVEATHPVGPAGDPEKTPDVVPN